jgi:hypothetical protein
MVLIVLLLHHPLVLSRQGTMTLQPSSNHFIATKNTHFDPKSLHVESFVFGCSGKKNMTVLTLPT